MQWTIQTAKEKIELNFSGIEVVIPKGMQMWEGKSQMLIDDKGAYDSTELHTKQLTITLEDREIEEKFTKSILVDEQKGR